MPTLPGQGLLPFELTPRQAALVESPPGEPQSLFLEGPAGSGKTTAGVAHLWRLLAEGVPADTILVLVPQRTLAVAYLDALRSPQAPPGAQIDVVTIGGLAQRSVELYWPLVAGPAGFAHPDRPPVFLTLETAQYYMDRIVEPYLERGAFGEVTVARPRLISQLLDNLNKAAVARFPYQEIGARLGQAWKGETSRLQVYEQVQGCVAEFRRFCLEHNLLDFALQIEVFARYVLALPAAAPALRRRYQHLLADNVEEDVPVAHDLLGDWLPGCESAWLIYDDQGGLRSYLGADPAGAYALRERCRAHVRWGDSLVCEPPVLGLAAGISRSLGFEVRSAGLGAVSPSDTGTEGGAPGPDGLTPGDERTQGRAMDPMDPRRAVVLLHQGFHTEVVRVVGSEVGRLVHDEGVPPGEIAILAPFMGDALRFALAQALERQGVATYSRRPSRTLRDEPAARCLLTLAKLAHPAWGLVAPKTDVAHALLAAIAEMDLVRAWHLAAIVYRPAGPRGALGSFEQIRAEEQSKVTYLLGNRYEALRAWLAAYAEGPALPLDHFFGRLFDEVLSRPGYVFHSDRDSAAVTAHLIDSARKFRHTVGDEELFAAGAFVGQVEQGVIAAQYVAATGRDPQAVLLAPAFTFVMMNRAVRVQFWLDLSSTAWGRRLFQPLTHPYVLSRHWPQGKPWTDADEDLANRQTLYRLLLGLLRRCRCRVCLADSTYSERGFEDHGMLQQVIFRTLRHAAQSEGAA